MSLFGPLHRMTLHRMNWMVHSPRGTRASWSSGRSSRCRVFLRPPGLFSADLFYTPEPEMFDVMRKYNILGVEMEAAGIYTCATELGAEALAICTVSDDITSGAALTIPDRQTTFDEMIRIALETVHLSDKTS